MQGAVRQRPASFTRNVPVSGAPSSSAQHTSLGRCDGLEKPQIVLNRDCGYFADIPSALGRNSPPSVSVFPNVLLEFVCAKPKGSQNIANLL